MGPAGFLAVICLSHALTLGAAGCQEISSQSLCLESESCAWCPEGGWCGYYYPCAEKLEGAGGEVCSSPLTGPYTLDCKDELYNFSWVCYFATVAGLCVLLAVFFYQHEKSKKEGGIEPKRGKFCASTPALFAVYYCGVSVVLLLLLSWVPAYTFLVFLAFYWALTTPVLSLLACAHCLGECWAKNREEFASSSVDYGTAEKKSWRYFFSPCCRGREPDSENDHLNKMWDDSL